MSLRNRVETGERVCAAAAVALGGIALLGFALRAPRLVRLDVGGGTAIAFNTALALALGGVTLLLPLPPRFERFTAALATAIATLAAGVLLENLLHRSLDLDAVRLHLWMGASPTPGRMAPSTCLGLLGFSLAFLLLPHTSGGARALAVRILALGTVAIGLAGTLGYVLQFDALYTWTAATRMAPQTAAGLSALGLGIWLRGQPVLWATTAPRSAASGRIVPTATVSLLLVAVVTGLGGLYLLQRLAQETAANDLMSRRDDRILYVDDLIEQRARRSLQDIAHVQSTPGHAAAVRTDWTPVAAGLLAQGYSGVDVLDAQGAVLARAGQWIEAPAMAATLHLPGAPQLLWRNGFFLKVEATPDGAPAIRLYVEAPLPLLAQLDATAAMGLCALRNATLVCFPSGPTDQPFTLAAWSGGLPWPLTTAFSGPPGWIQSTDHRGQRVLAAYGAVGDTGLALLLKRDLDDLYAPVRRRFELILPLLALLILLGVAAMQWQVLPLESRLVALAHNDSLTGLANRATFLDRLERAVESARHDPARGNLGLLYLDVDRFKSANDTFGHAAGDCLLREVAARITASVRTADTVARLGGDEFTILLEGLYREEDAERAAHAIRASLAAPFAAGGPQVVTASIGVVYWRADGAEFNADALLHHADAALYEVKRRGRDGVLLVPA